jgi:hypothetical protein
LYGYEANIGAVPSVPSETPTSIAEVIENREKHLEALKYNLARAHNRMKTIADQKRKDF